MMNKEIVVEKLAQKTGREKVECEILYQILKRHSIVGRKNKEKIMEDIIENLNLTKEEANSLYNILAELRVQNFFERD